jgi:peptide deformylase
MSIRSEPEGDRRRPEAEPAGPRLSAVSEQREEETGAGEGPEGLEPEVLERRREALGLVRQFGDPVLKSKASPVTDFGPALVEEAERMIAIMSDALGVGLAATQLGALRRMLVFRAGPDSEARALVNPEIEWRSEEAAVAEEGCLSLAAISVDVERPVHARLRGRDLAGEPLLIEASGLEARVLQHEVDHLDGVLILDRTPREQRRAALRALRGGESFSPAMLEREDDEEGETEPARNGGPPEGEGSPRS